MFINTHTLITSKKKNWKWKSCLISQLTVESDRLILVWIVYGYGWFSGGLQTSWAFREQSKRRPNGRRRERVRTHTHSVAHILRSSAHLIITGGRFMSINFTVNIGMNVCVSVCVYISWLLDRDPQGNDFDFWSSCLLKCNRCGCYIAHCAHDGLVAVRYP